MLCHPGIGVENGLMSAGKQVNRTGTVTESHRLTGGADIESQTHRTWKESQGEQGIF